MVNRNDSFLREVDEDVRRDQFLKLWEHYGIYAIAVVALLFVGVGGYKWRESRLAAAEERSGAQYEAASKLASEGKAEDAARAFSEIAKDGPAGYRALARLRLAGQEAKAGKVAEALTAYEALSNDSGADDLLRDFAALQAAVLRSDQADWTEMKNRLTPLLDDKRPWHAAARELLGLTAYKAGQTEEATKLFEQILGDRTTTQGVNKRAQEMLAVLTDAAAAKAQAASPSGTSDGKGTPAKATDAKGAEAPKK